MQTLLASSEDTAFAALSVQELPLQVIERGTAMLRESKASSKATAEALGGAYLVYGNERYDEWVSVEME